MSPTKNHILILLSSSEQTSFDKEDFASQSLPQKVFSAIWEVESEVNNGGFAQYFLNSSAESASFVVEALETVGAHPRQQASASVPYMLLSRLGCRNRLRPFARRQHRLPTRRLLRSNP